MPQRPHSRSLRANRRMAAPGTWLVTNCLQPRKPLLLRHGMATVVIGSIEHQIARGHLFLAAFCLMPDHWHAVLAAPLLVRTMQNTNSWIAHETGPLLRRLGASWQDGYHDVRVRSSRQLSYMVDYVEGNPVRSGLCDCPSDWRWSSAHPDYAEMVLRPWPWMFENDKA